MKKLWLYAIAMSFATASCTKDKTDYEAELNAVVTEHYEFKEAVSINAEGYKISIESLNGAFYKGYNEIRLKIKNAQSDENVYASAVNFLPVMTDADKSKTSCPHRYNLVYEPNDRYFSGYTVFTSEDDTNRSWELYISFIVNNKTFTAKQAISVHQQTNKNLNMTAFTGNDDEQYFIALIAPQKPKVAENELVAGIYKFDKPTNPAGTFPDPSQFLYSEVKNYTLKLDPRMPEPSMGNHSSPGNQDLAQRDNGFYQGIVNYTMTGNWTLNFIMLNQNGRIIKGTEVPKDFTPGVNGAKSELHIDILF